MGALRSPLPSKVDASYAIAVLESFGWEQRDGLGNWLCLEPPENSPCVFMSHEAMTDREDLEWFLEQNEVDIAEFWRRYDTH